MNNEMTGNKIGVEGVKAMSELFQMNTTLTTLNLWSQRKRRGTRKKREK